MTRLIIFHPTWRILLGLLILSILGCDGGPKLSPLSDDARILAFGDSLTFGKGAKESEAYPAVLERLTGLDVINEGVSGETSAEGMERLEALLEEYQPDLVILFEGGNDILRNVPEGETVRNLSSMINLVKQNMSEVLIVAVPNKNLFAGASPIYDQIAKDFPDIPVERDLVGGLLKTASLKSDMVHLNAEGYRRLAHGILEKLQTTGAL